MAVDSRPFLGPAAPTGLRSSTGVVEPGTGPDGGRLLDHVEVDVKHNEVTHLTGYSQNWT